MRRAFIGLVAAIALVGCGTSNTVPDYKSSSDFVTAKAVIELRQITEDPSYLDFLLTEEAHKTKNRRYHQGQEWLKRYPRSVTDKAINIVKDKEHKGE